MTVRRIVPNIAATDPAECADFYRRVFDLEVVMDFGWIVTLKSPGADGPVQLSTASEGGSGTQVPGLSIEVDDVDEVLDRACALGLQPDYGPVIEPWGVRRFYLRDPSGTLLNILSHKAPDSGA